MDSVSVKIGDRVSLNTFKRLYFFQGEGGLNLGVESREVDVIPKKITEAQLKQIDMAVKAGDLILGWPEEKTKIPERESDLKELIKSLNINKMMDWVRDIRDNPNMASDIKIDKLESILDLEKKGRNNLGLIKVIERCLNSIGGISSVTEVVQEKVEIKLSSGTDEAV
jgi:hypothetical protein